MEQYLKSGLVSDSKVLDIRQVDIQSGKMLELGDAEVPVFVVTFATQEVLLFRNAKTREVVVGREDRVEQCTYAAVITRIEEELDDELTAGWKVVEVSRRICGFRLLTAEPNFLVDDAPLSEGLSLNYKMPMARRSFLLALIALTPLSIHIRHMSVYILILMRQQ
jgi:hypothetical protein